MKRTNIICISAFTDDDERNFLENTVLRTTAVNAARLVATGHFQFTTKGKLKHFLNLQIKFHKNNRAIEKHRQVVALFTDKIVKHREEKIAKVRQLPEYKSLGYPTLTRVNDDTKGKTYAYLGLGIRNVPTFPDMKDIDPLTGRPRVFYLQEPYGELRLVGATGS